VMGVPDETHGGSSGSHGTVTEVPHETHGRSSGTHGTVTVAPDETHGRNLEVAMPFEIGAPSAEKTTAPLFVVGHRPCCGRSCVESLQTS
jgi:hypothetical protein